MWLKMKLEILTIWSLLELISIELGKVITNGLAEYINTFAGATLSGATEAEAHAAARVAAETGRFDLVLQNLKLLLTKY